MLLKSILLVFTLLAISSPAEATKKHKPTPKRILKKFFTQNPGCESIFYPDPKTKCVKGKPPPQVPGAVTIFDLPAYKDKRLKRKAAGFFGTCTTLAVSPHPPFETGFCTYEFVLEGGKITATQTYFADEDPTTDIGVVTSMRRRRSTKEFVLPTQLVESRNNNVFTGTL